MYSQLDKVFLLGMSSPHIIEMDYVVRPPKLGLFRKNSKNDQEEEEEEKAMDQQSKVLREGEDDNFTLPASSSSSSYQDDHDHAHETKMTREVEVFFKKNIVSTDVDDDDEGYHTPTSPRHRIPAALECPLAPRKCWWRQQQQQRRTKRGRTVCLCLVAKIDGGDDMLMAKTKKKARE